MNIKNTVAVVTGAGRGLGFETACTLAKEGARVIAAEINEESCLAAAGKLPEGLDIRFWPCNVSDEKSVETFFGRVGSEFGRVDILVNNAGITNDGLLVKVSESGIAKMSLEQFQGVLNVNLAGVFLCGREAAILMAKTGGVIINISSVSRGGNFGQTNYSAAKAGVDAMTVTWSKELVRYGIRCAGIAPGYLRTEMTAKIREDVINKVIEKIPLKRLGEMSEISATVKFIIENDYVNGRILEIDGGLRI
jgi:3-oxoacyl-[acyl-carrier protein] reductase